MPRLHVDPTDGDEGLRTVAPARKERREEASASLVESARRLAEDMNRAPEAIAKERGWALEASYCGVLTVWRDQRGTMWMCVGGQMREVA